MFQVSQRAFYLTGVLFVFCVISLNPLFLLLVSLSGGFGRDSHIDASDYIIYAVNLPPASGLCQSPPG